MEVGVQVEVRIDEEGLQGGWFKATIVEAMANGNFLVQCLNLKDVYDVYAPRKVEVLAQNIRLPPPETDVDVPHYKFQDQVDAFVDNGWWGATICDIPSRHRSLVHLWATDEELQVPHTRLRKHHS